MKGYQVVVEYLQCIIDASSATRIPPRHSPSSWSFDPLPGDFFSESCRCLVVIWASPLVPTDQLGVDNLRY
jgi:hypothetical protein